MGYWQAYCHGHTDDNTAAKDTDTSTSSTAELRRVVLLLFMLQNYTLHDLLGKVWSLWCEFELAVSKCLLVNHDRCIL